MTPQVPRGQFWWVLMAPKGHPGCIPPRSNRDPAILSHAYGQNDLFYGIFWLFQILTLQKSHLEWSEKKSEKKRWKLAILRRF